MVCIATPLPMAVLVLLQESVPLQDPLEGWSANYGFWIRAGILGGVVAVGMAAFAIYMIPGVVLSNLQLALIFIGQAVGYPAIAMLIASLWVFPIPFMVLSIISLYVLLFVALFRIIAGKQVFSQIATHRTEFILLVSFSGSQSVMAVTYAAYEVLFDHVTNTHYELPVILLLPVIKLIMKNLVSLPMAHMKDMVPEGVIFTVDFFNSMYLATCMQNTSSITTVATMMALDFGQTAISLRSLHRQSDTILSRLREACGISLDNDSLLPVVRLLCHDSDKFEQQSRRDILVTSCLPQKLSPQGRDLLEKLKTLSGNGVRTLPRFSTTAVRSKFKKIQALKPFWICCRRTERVEPSAISTTTVKPARNDPLEASETMKIRSDPDSPHRNILGQTLEVLFFSECLLLTEYLESIIPVLYGLFILLVVNLPSAPYHVDLIGINRDNVGDTLANVYIYAFLEFVSFVTLTLLMMRNCRLQALCHLAFVLETQMLLVQVKLVTWVLMSLSFRVVHFGADFTFQFSWMDQNNA
ncbi:hypothetical protein PI124_g12795 [Phytophthora idaei]|nr:hypothetical protein PI126_g5735 [Phytophthora idaei]KAG3242352.1 hypothetical protein PI124_g12795 [Phytophthora idaei]